MSAIDNLLKHSDNEISADDFGGFHEINQLLANISIALTLSNYTFLDVKINVSVFLRQVCRDFFTELTSVATRSHMNDCWLNILVNFLHRIVKISIRIYLCKISVLLKERNQLSCILVILFDLLRKNG